MPVYIIATVASARVEARLLFCGGNFTTAFTLPRNRAAAFDATTGSLRTAASVEAMQIISGNIYLGG